MASEKLIKELNDQFNFELLSGYHYMGMAAYCSAEGMNGFAHFFIEQAKEEYLHAMKFYNFIYDIDGRVETQAMIQPKNDFASFVEVFEAALGHEKAVTARINNLMGLAMDEKAYPAVQFLQWFVGEQVEEETTMKDIIFKLEKMGDHPHSLFMLDSELGSRAPTETNVAAE